MSSDWIEKRLREERPEHSVPVGFTERVMSRLPAQEVAVTEKTAAEFPWGRFMAATATLAMVGVLAFQVIGRKSESPLAAQPETLANPASVGTVAMAAFDVPKITPVRLDDLTKQIEQPLQKELENVISDTRTAVQFVASHFLPEE